MRISIECDSDQPRETEPPPPFRDFCEVVHYGGLIQCWMWFCPCPRWESDTPWEAPTEAEATALLNRHLAEAHGEEPPLLYRDGAKIQVCEVSECGGDIGYVWECSCGAEDPEAHWIVNDVVAPALHEARACLDRHLASAHGE